MGERSEKTTTAYRFLSSIAPSSFLLRVLERKLAQLLVQGIAIDAEAGGGLNLDVVAQLHDLLDQLAFNSSDQAFVQVPLFRGQTLNADADQMLNQAQHISRSGPGRPKPTLMASGQGKHSRLERMAIGHDDSAFDVIFQLAHIARPIVFLKRLEHFGCQLRRVPAILFAVTFQEELT